MKDNKKHCMILLLMISYKEIINLDNKYLDLRAIKKIKFYKKNKLNYLKLSERKHLEIMKK